MDGQSTFLMDSCEIDTQKAPWYAVNSKGSRWKIVKYKEFCFLTYIMRKPLVIYDFAVYSRTQQILPFF